jgi:hypothetical protein
VNAEDHSEALLRRDNELKHLDIQETEDKQHHRVCQKLWEVKRLLGRYGTYELL